MTVGQAMVEKVPGGYRGKAAPAKAPKTGKIRSIEIEPSDNGGFTVTCRHDQPVSSLSPSRYIEPSKNVFEDAGSMVAYIAKAFGEGK